MTLLQKKGTARVVSVPVTLQKKGTARHRVVFTVPVKTTRHRAVP